MVIHNISNGDAQLVYLITHFKLYFVITWEHI